MSPQAWLHAGATLTGAVALWLLLPKARPRQFIIGIFLGAIALGPLGAALPRLGDALNESLFAVTAVITVVAPSRR